MKLLFDENISHRILKKLNIEFKDSIHCKSINPYPKNDLDIWMFAKINEYTIVTFDEDYYEWMLLKGYPPKIIWLRTGNTSTNDIAKLINDHISDLKEFLENENLGIVEINQ